MTEKKINKSAKDGRIVSEEYLKKHPATTYKQTVVVPKLSPKKK